MLCRVVFTEVAERLFELLSPCSGRGERGGEFSNFVNSTSLGDGRNSSRKFLRVYETSVGFTSIRHSRLDTVTERISISMEKHSRNRFLIRKPKKIASPNRGTKSFFKLRTNARFFKTNIAAKSHSIIRQLHFGSNMCNYRAEINCFSVFSFRALRDPRPSAWRREISPLADDFNCFLRKFLNPLGKLCNCRS